MIYRFAMRNYLFAVFLIFCCWKIVFCYHYETKTLTVPVDHFSFATKETFQMRYLINDTHWDQSKGPIFLYTGNEGNIEWFAENTGFVWETAPEFKALIVFAEHRYYGNSLPFGNLSYVDPKYLGYLTSQQALADYVDLILYLQKNKTEGYKNPVIAFGGSYGGMLAAYLRMKYPHIVCGALAASAPIWQFTDMTPCDIFWRIVTKDFSAENKTCSESIRKSWAAIDNVASTDEGLQWLSTEWKLCEPLKSKDDVRKLKSHLKNSYGTLAMVNYPYPTNFLVELPGHPVREFCKHLTSSTADNKDLLRMLFQGVSVFYNYTGKSKCLAIGQSTTPDLGEEGWYYQTCTEIVMPTCSNGVSDMFEPQEWDLKEFSDNCFEYWQTTPDPFFMAKTYGGRDLGTASNIIFSNGYLDPWGGGGVLIPPSKSIGAFVIPEGAHHLDLRESNPADPPSVQEIRSKYQNIFRDWIQEYHKKFP